MVAAKLQNAINVFENMFNENMFNENMFNENMFNWIDHIPLDQIDNNTEHVEHIEHALQDSTHEELSAIINADIMFAESTEIISNSRRTNIEYVLNPITDTYYPVEYELINLTDDECIIADYDVETGEYFRVR